MTAQLSLLDYPTQKNFKRPGTSEAAAKKAAWDSNKLRKDCFDALMVRGPSTADEIAAYLDEHWIRIRPRIAECARLGLIYDTKARRPSAMGNSSIVWAVVTSSDQLKIPKAA